MRPIFLRMILELVHWISVAVVVLSFLAFLIGYFFGIEWMHSYGVLTTFTAIFVAFVVRNELRNL